jgi:hypothetical protein
MNAPIIAAAALIGIVVLGLGAVAVLTCVGGTRARREQPRPISDERNGTSYAPLDHDDTTTAGPWDEVRPGSGPRRGRREAL